MDTNTLANLKTFCFMLYIPFIALMNYTGLNAVAIESLSVLIVIDLLTGIIKTILIGKKPTSRRLADGIVAKLMLLLIPISVAIATKGLGLSFAVLIDTSLSILILSELYSIVANIYVIDKRKEVEEFDAVSILLRIIRGWIDRTPKEIK